ncbi:fasciclin domain-containing protein [Pedobacter nutrimenti]|uniref:Putative surface protein with fasciclin (FAS1) repeats n=1 Tax=Pedobacter nutrimenti TaxID=1241337 RepID=A0A318UIR4_9SPHI|nr:fasciclin domain-containing protein [Pedobacter nutrimenti]PYF75207.1 putative surface protein with fasciclin (FAS1) repeats [Pedobacter nutrimenti]
MNLKLYQTGNALKLLAICLLLLSMFSCRKKEFQPEVEGAKIPTQDINITLKEALETSAFTLFKAAWKKSNMSSILEKKGNKTPFTLLVPTDAACVAGGLTQEFINKTAPELLDSILLYHTLIGATDAKTLSGRGENTIGMSLLTNKYLRVYGYENLYRTDIYTYRQYLNVVGPDLFINNKKASSAVPVQTKDGTLWPIDRLLIKPTKTIYEVLKEDGRFGMYISIMEKTDELWDEIMQGMGERPKFKQGLSVYSTSDGNPNIGFTSIFAPTDAAFRLAGFKDVDDLMNLNNRATLPYFDWDTYTPVGNFVTDSLLTMHRWGKLFQPYNPNSGSGNPTPDIFYANDLNNRLLANYTLVTSRDGSLPVYTMPLDFGLDAGKRVTVKAKQSPHPAATVVEQDINTLMGPIHVVDRLIPPKDFKY